MKCSLGISNFLDEISSLSHSTVFLYFFAVITDHWGRLSYLSLLFFRTLHSNGYFSFSPLTLNFLLFWAICRDLFRQPFCLIAFVFLEDDFGHCLLSSVTNLLHRSLVTLSDLKPWIYLSLPLCNHKGVDLVHAWMVAWFSLLSSI